MIIYAQIIVRKYENKYFFNVSKFYRIGLNGNTVSKELQPTALVEKVQRLEMENKALREGQGGQTALTVSNIFLIVK